MNEKMSIDSVQVTWVDNVKKPHKCSLVLLKQVIAKIRGLSLKEKTEEIRAASEEEQSRLKLLLPAIVFAGEFSYANEDGLEKHSGLLVVDFDGIPPADISRFKSALHEDPHTACVFISPRGKGLKWVVATRASDAESHTAAFKHVQAYLRGHFPDLFQFLDEKCSDLCRKCFLGHDAEIHVGTPSQQFSGDAIHPSKSNNTGSEHKTEAGSQLICSPVDQSTSPPVDQSTSPPVNQSTSPPVTQPISPPVTQVNQPTRDSSGSSFLVPPPTGTGEPALVPTPSAAQNFVDPTDPKLRERVTSLVPTEVHNTHLLLFKLGRLCLEIERDQGLDPNGT